MLFIGLILIVVFFIGGFQYIMKKFFGTELTSRSNHNNAIKMQNMRNSTNYQNLKKIDPNLIELAINNLKSKKFAITIDNVTEEVLKIKSKNS